MGEGSGPGDLGAKAHILHEAKKNPVYITSRKMRNLFVTTQLFTCVIFVWEFSFSFFFEINVLITFQRGIVRTVVFLFL